MKMFLDDHAKCQSSLPYVLLVVVLLIIKIKRNTPY